MQNQVIKNSKIDTPDCNKNNSFNLDSINTSWMSTVQKRYFYALKDPSNRVKTISELTAIAGYKNNQSWYIAFSDSRFRSVLEKINVRPRSKMHPPHYEVEYIKNSKEIKEYLENDVWDMRKLFKDYPRQNSPNTYIVNFKKVSNISLRNTVKSYFKIQLGKWEAPNFKWALGYMVHFINVMESIFPNINSFSELKRDIHVESILSSMNCSKNTKKESLNLMKAMFDYMFINKWKDGPTEYGLIVRSDVPKKDESLPKPIPPNIIKDLDEYITDIILPLLRGYKQTPIIDPMYWDMIIVIRNTGIRFEDLCHLEENFSELDKDCMQYDNDGDFQLYLNSRISKANQELLIPLAHLNDKYRGNLVEEAVLRQKERVAELPPCCDGYTYLFRISMDRKYKSKIKKVVDKSGKEIVDVVSREKFRKILNKICSIIPLKDLDGNIYKITSHQFRHTVATEMINAGVSLYAIKKFLGHSNLDTTEKYIKLYRESLKKQLNEKLGGAYLYQNRNNVYELHNYDEVWVKENIANVFELGDGSCEIQYMDNTCPNMKCKLCIKRRIYPRHLQAVKRTIESNEVLRERAKDIGLVDKYKEFDEIVRFYTIALNIITKGEIFIASKHFYCERDDLDDSR